MIESIEFKNFKALRDTILPLSPFTLIIGPNGSGKSTVFQALRLLNLPSSLQYSQIISIGQHPESSVKVTVSWIEANDKLSGYSQWYSPSDNDPRHFDMLVMPYLKTRLAGKQVEDSAAKEKAIKETLSKLQVFSFDAKAIAMPAHIQPYVELSENGGNLAAVLDHLDDTDRERFEALSEELGRLLPEYDRILFETPQQGQKSFLLRTREGHYRIPANDLSDGTLLALALLTLAYLPDPPPTICIEEPDRGIHPRLLRDVSDALNRLAYPESVGEKRQPVQVIATTHSPYFLDMYKDFPEQVVITNKIGQEVKFERLSDRPHYEDIIQDASLGDAWYTGIFGGVPAHP